MFHKTMESLLAVQKLQQDTEKAQDSGNPVKLAQFQEKTEKTAIKELKENDDMSDGSDFGATDNDFGSDDSGDDDFPTLEDYTSWTGYKQELGTTQEFTAVAPEVLDFSDLSGLDMVGIEQGFGQYANIPEKTMFMFSLMGKMLGSALSLATQTKQDIKMRLDKESYSLIESAEKIKAILATGDDQEIKLTGSYDLWYATIGRRYEPANVRVYTGLVNRLFTTISSQLKVEDKRFVDFHKNPGCPFEFLRIDPYAFNMKNVDISSDPMVSFIRTEDTLRNAMFFMDCPKVADGSLEETFRNFRKATFSRGYPKSMQVGSVYVTAYDLLELISSVQKLILETQANLQELDNSIFVNGSISYLVKQLFLDIGPASAHEARRDELVSTYSVKIGWIFGALFMGQITMLRFSQEVIEHLTNLVSQETTKFS